MSIFNSDEQGWTKEGKLKQETLVTDKIGPTSTSNLHKYSDYTRLWIATHTSILRCLFALQPVRRSKPYSGCKCLKWRDFWSFRMCVSPAQIFIEKRNQGRNTKSSNGLGSWQSLHRWKSGRVWLLAYQVPVNITGGKTFKDKFGWFLWKDASNLGQRVFRNLYVLPFIFKLPK